MITGNGIRFKIMTGTGIGIIKKFSVLDPCSAIAISIVNCFFWNGIPSELTIGHDDVYLRSIGTGCTTLLINCLFCADCLQRLHSDSILLEGIVVVRPADDPTLLCHVKFALEVFRTNH